MRPVEGLSIKKTCCNLKWEAACCCRTGSSDVYMCTGHLPGSAALEHPTGLIAISKQEHISLIGPQICNARPACQCDCDPSLAWSTFQPDQWRQHPS